MDTAPARRNERENERRMRDRSASPHVYDSRREERDEDFKHRRRYSRSRSRSHSRDRNRDRERDRNHRDRYNSESPSPRGRDKERGRNRERYHSESPSRERHGRDRRRYRSRSASRSSRERSPSQRGRSRSVSPNRDGTRRGRRRERRRNRRERKRRLDSRSRSRSPRYEDEAGSRSSGASPPRRRVRRRDYSRSPEPEYNRGRREYGERDRDRRRNRRELRRGRGPHFDEHATHSLFIAALDNATQRHRIPFNVSIVNDRMRQLDPEWDIANSDYKRFADLCNDMHRRGILQVARLRETICVVRLMHPAPQRPLEGRPDDDGGMDNRHDNHQSRRRDDRDEARRYRDRDDERYSRRRDDERDDRHQHRDDDDNRGRSQDKRDDGDEVMRDANNGSSRERDEKRDEEEKRSTLTREVKDATDAGNSGALGEVRTERVVDDDGHGDEMRDADEASRKPETMATPRDDDKHSVAIDAEKANGTGGSDENAETEIVTDANGKPEALKATADTVAAATSSVNGDSGSKSEVLDTENKLGKEEEKVDVNKALTDNDDGGSLRDAKGNGLGAENAERTGGIVDNGGGIKEMNQEGKTDVKIEAKTEPNRTGALDKAQVTEKNNNSVGECNKVEVET